MKTLTPYLSFHGTCEAALKFYAEAFNGTITELKRFGDAPAGASPHPNKDHVMHARFEAEQVKLMASDGRDKDSTGEPQISLSVELTDRAEQEKVFGKLSAGGKVTMPLADQFWGARFGMLVDKFGIHWMLNCETKK
jgi:PhnB protein